MLVRLESKDLDRIPGEDGYARLHCGDKSCLVAERLYVIEQRLAGSHFIRIRRPILVDRDRIAGLRAGSGSWIILVVSGDRVATGRSYLAG